MLSPNQIRCINDYYDRSGQDLYLCCERNDCDVDQMQEIIAALDPLLPGKGLDYVAILAGDPLASDPLLIHCNQTIGRLNEIYLRTMHLYDHSGQRDFTINKRTTVNVPPDWANPSFHDGEFHFKGNHDGTEKIETTTYPDKQRLKILETAMKCLDRAMKIQITLTHRKEKLESRETHQERKAKHPGPPTSPSADRPHTGFDGYTSYSAMRGYPLNRLSGAFLSDDEDHPEDQELSARHSNGHSVSSVFQKESGNPGCRTRLPGQRSRKKPAQDDSPRTSQPEASANPTASGGRKSPESPDHTYREITTNIVAQLQAHLGEEEHVTKPQETPDSTERFGTPKDFTPTPTVLEVRGDRYPWRTAHKAQKQSDSQESSTSNPGPSSPSQPEASARDTAPEPPPRDPEDPLFHKRE